MPVEKVINLAQYKRDKALNAPCTEEEAKLSAKVDALFNTLCGKRADLEIALRNKSKD